jgi:hypothetical protein
MEKSRPTLPLGVAEEWGGMGAWRRGGVAAWRRGGVAAWRRGGVEACGVETLVGNR